RAGLAVRWPWRAPEGWIQSGLGGARRITMGDCIRQTRRRVVKRVGHIVSGAAAMPSVEERIRAEIEGHPIMLFMKGTAQYPMCGFSSRAVQALCAAGADKLY